MFDLANATVISATVEEALPIFAEAERLGFPNTDLLGRRIAALETLRDGNIWSGVSANDYWLTVVVLSGAALLVGVIMRHVLWRRVLALLGSASGN